MITIIMQTTTSLGDAAASRTPGSTETHTDRISAPGVGGAREYYYYYYYYYDYYYDYY